MDPADFRSFETQREDKSVTLRAHSVNTGPAALTRASVTDSLPTSHPPQTIRIQYVGSVKQKVGLIQTIVKRMFGPELQAPTV